MFKAKRSFLTPFSFSLFLIITAAICFSYYRVFRAIDQIVSHQAFAHIGEHLPSDLSGGKATHSSVILRQAQCGIQPASCHLNFPLPNRTAHTAVFKPYSSCCVATQRNAS